MAAAGSNLCPAGALCDHQHTQLTNTQPNRDGSVFSEAAGLHHQFHIAAHIYFFCSWLFKYETHMQCKIEMGKNKMWASPCAHKYNTHITFVSEQFFLFVSVTFQVRPHALVFDWTETKTNTSAGAGSCCGCRLVWIKKKKKLISFGKSFASCYAPDSSWS